MTDQNCSVPISPTAREHLETVASLSGMDRPTALSTLIAHGMTSWRREFALEEYTNGSISLGKATEIADMSSWSFLEYLDDNGSGITYDVAEFERDLAALSDE